MLVSATQHCSNRLESVRLPSGRPQAYACRGEPADLLATNQELQQEVVERARAEQSLRETQDELIHAGKLAVLGQMAAGITHEINQPLAALRTLSDNTATRCAAA